MAAYSLDILQLLCIYAFIAYSITWLLFTLFINIIAFISSIITTIPQTSIIIIIAIITIVIIIIIVIENRLRNSLLFYSFSYIQLQLTTSVYQSLLQLSFLFFKLFYLVRFDQFSSINVLVYLFISRPIFFLCLYPLSIFF